jgi:hypothetical protein
MSTDRDYVRPDRPSRYDRDDDYDDEDERRGRRRRHDRVGYSDRAQDEEHLRILSILYYVLGGLQLLAGLVPLIWVVIGIALVAAGASDASGGAPPAVMGFFFIVIAGGISLLILALAACKFFTGYSLGQRKNYMFCFVIACLTCMWMPLGTLLGVFTIVVLMRPGVKEMFGVAEPAARYRADR